MALPNAPQSRNEKYLAKIAGQEVELPNEPLSREEQYLEYIATHGGGGGSSLEAGDYIEIDANNKINVKMEKGDTTEYEYRLTGEYSPTIQLTIEKYMDGELISTESYINDDTYTPIDIDGLIEIWYSAGYPRYYWCYKLLEDSREHSTNYEDSWYYTDTTTRTEIFDVEDSSLTLVRNCDLAPVAKSGSYSDLNGNPSINGVELSGNKTASQLGLMSSLEAGDYIDITEGVISVKKEKGEYLLERYVLQSTAGGVPKLVVKKYIDSELISTNQYANNTAHVNIDDTLEIWYSYNPYNWHYKLLVDGVDHSAGYEYEFSYEDTTEYPVDFHIAAGDSTDLVTKADLEDAVDEITDNLTASNDVPFRFGYDQSTGKYGYILNQGGADTVIPFSNSEGYNLFTFGECYSYCVNDSVAMTARYTAEHSTKYVFFFIASDAFDVPEINVTVTINGVSKTELVKEMYRDENSYFDVKYICVELEVGDVCVFNTTGTKGTGTSSAIYGARVSREFNTGDIIDSDKYAGVSTPEYLTSTIEETGSYFLFFFARCSNNNVRFNELSINDVPYDIFTVLKYDGWSAAIGITYAELQENDVVKIGGGQWGGYYTSEAFGIISAE